MTENKKECLVLEAMDKCKCNNCKCRRRLEAFNLVMKSQLDIQRNINSLLNKEKRSEKK
jgi:hypothetical protein